MKLIKENKKVAMKLADYDRRYEVKHKEEATRHNKGKLKWSLVDYESLEPMVRVLEFGMNKYSRDNWKKGMYKDEVIESLLRHIYAYLGGELVDKESGISHVGHILVNSMFISYFETHGFLTNNNKKEESK